MNRAQARPPGAAKTSRPAQASPAPAPGEAEAPAGTARSAGSGTGGVSARDVAARVVSCPGVAGLSTGPFGTLVTYLPREVVPGVTVRDDEIEVHLVARYGTPLPELAASVRDALGDLSAGRRVNVTIEDLTPAEKNTGKEERS